MGRKIAACDLPTLFVMEGGYAVDALGANTVNVPQGIDRGLIPGLSAIPFVTPASCAGVHLSAAKARAPEKWIPALASLGRDDERKV